MLEGAPAEPKATVAVSNFGRVAGARRTWRLAMSTVTSDAVIIPEESSISAVSWSAIAAGAVVSAAFSLFLLHLVTGLGLVSVSPWSGSGASGSTIHVAGGIALILMAVMASPPPGYFPPPLANPLG